jgi:hypothetical protein
MDTKSFDNISLGENMSHYSFEINNPDTINENTNNVGENTNNVTENTAGENIINESENINKKKFTNDEVDEFKESARKYFKIDDELKILQKKTLLLRKEKIKCTKNILEFMEYNSIKDINTNSGKLRYTVTYKKDALNKKLIKSKLAEYFKNNDKALDCFKFIDNRSKTEQAKLKRFKK